VIYTIAEVARLHREELLRRADQRRLAQMARPAARTSAPAPTTSAVLTGMGRGLMALGLQPEEERRPRRV